MKQKSSGKKWILILIVLASLGGAYACFYWLPSKEPKPAATSEDNPDSINPDDTGAPPADAQDAQGAMPDEPGTDEDLPLLPPEQRPNSVPQDGNQPPSQDADINRDNMPKRYQSPPNPTDLMRDDDDLITPPPPIGGDDDRLNQPPNREQYPDQNQEPTD